MNGWLALSLTLLLAQAPVSPERGPLEDEGRFPSVQPGLQPGEADPAPPGAVRPGPADEFPLVQPGPGPTVEPEPETDLSPAAETSPGVRLGPEPGEQPVEPFEEQPFEEAPEELSAAQELRRLRLRIEELEAQVRREEQQARTRLQEVEQQQAAQRARALELEQLQQQRLISLERAYGWINTADERLAVGDLDGAGPALTYAAEALSTALATALESGRGQTVRLIERARDRIAWTREAIERRDAYPARWELSFAASELLEAWRLALNRPDIANVIR